MVAQREAWAQAVLEVARVDERIVVLDGDLATSTKASTFAEELPERFYQMGIAEQNLVGVAAGMATLGNIPWVATFGVFFTQRSLDQIRMLVAQSRANVKIAGHYTGLLNGGSGKTHQDIEDLAILRAMPGMTVIAPADGRECRAAVRWAVAYDGPVYLRLARDDEADVMPEDYELAPDTVVRLREGEEVALVSTGVQTARTARAAELLQERGVSVAHFHVPFLKPLSDATVLSALGGFHEVITVEEHSVMGGLGGLVAEVIAAGSRTTRVRRIGLADEWSESGPNAFLLERYGLSAERVADQVADLLLELG
jgi:transketolase